MSQEETFNLKNEAMNIDFGKIIFNGKFAFVLNDSISPEVWNNIGFIPISDNERRVESEDLFYYLNSRLPIDLRKKPAKDKLEYIKTSGLRVASDSFSLIPA